MSDRFVDGMILGLNNGSSGILKKLSVTENGIYLPSDSGYDAYNPVSVAVQPDTESLAVTSNGTYTSDKDGYSSVSVDVELDTTALNVTEPGTYTCVDGSAYDPVVVNLIHEQIYKNGLMTPIEVDNFEDAKTVFNVFGDLLGYRYPRMTLQITDLATGVSLRYIRKFKFGDWYYSTAVGGWTISGDYEQEWLVALSDGTVRHVYGYYTNWCWGARFGVFYFWKPKSYYVVDSSTGTAYIDFYAFNGAWDSEGFSYKWRVISLGNIQNNYLKHFSTTSTRYGIAFIDDNI